MKRHSYDQLQKSSCINNIYDIPCCEICWSLYLKSRSSYRDSTDIGATVLALKISFVRFTCFFNLAIALADFLMSTPFPTCLLNSSAKYSTKRNSISCPPSLAFHLTSLTCHKWFIIIAVTNFGAEISKKVEFFFKKKFSAFAPHMMNVRSRTLSIYWPAV